MYLSIKRRSAVQSTSIEFSLSGPTAEAEKPLFLSASPPTAAAGSKSSINRWVPPHPARSAALRPTNRASPCTTSQSTTGCTKIPITKSTVRSFKTHSGSKRHLSSAPLYLTQGTLNREADLIRRPTTSLRGFPRARRSLILRCLTCRRRGRSLNTAHSIRRPTTSHKCLPRGRT